MRFKKYFTSIGFILLLAASCVFLYFNYYNSTIDISSSKAVITSKTDTLVKDFIKNENLANSKYVNKIIEIEGVLKEVSLKNNVHTLLLKSSYKNTYIICELTHQPPLKKIPQVNQNIKIKGICKGFLNDVIFLNCILIP